MNMTWEFVENKNPSAPIDNKHAVKLISTFSVMHTPITLQNLLKLPILIILRTLLFAPYFQEQLPFRLLTYMHNVHTHAH